VKLCETQRISNVKGMSPKLRSKGVLLTDKLCGDLSPACHSLKFRALTSIRRRIASLISLTFVRDLFTDLI